MSSAAPPNRTDAYSFQAATDAEGRAVCGGLVARDAVAHLGVSGDVAEFEASRGISRDWEFSNLTSPTSNLIDVPVPMAGDAVVCT